MPHLGWTDLRFRGTGASRGLSRAREAASAWRGRARDLWSGSAPGQSPGAPAGPGVAADGPSDAAKSPSPADDIGEEQQAHPSGWSPAAAFPRVLPARASVFGSAAMSLGRSKTMSPLQVMRLREELRQPGASSDTVPPTFTVEELVRLLMHQQAGTWSIQGQRLPTCKKLKQTVSRTARLWTVRMRRQRGVRIDVDDWIHHMLLHYSGEQSGRAISELKGMLDKAVLQDPYVLETLQGTFHAAADGHGALSLLETVELYSRSLLCYSTGSSMACAANGEESPAEGPRKLAGEVVRALELDGSAAIAFADFAACFLGRQRHEVKLFLYDISNGSLDKLSRWLPMQDVAAIWHTSVVVYDWEYVYCGHLICEKPGTTAFGPPCKAISIGHTWRQRKELHHWVCTALKPTFTISSYDMLQNNCNHFTERVCEWLCDRHVPAEIMLQPDRILRLPAARGVWGLVKRLGPWGGRSQGSASCRPERQRSKIML